MATTVLLNDITADGESTPQEISGLNTLTIQGAEMHNKFELHFDGAVHGVIQGPPYVKSFTTGKVDFVIKARNVRSGQTIRAEINDEV